MGKIDMNFDKFNTIPWRTSCNLSEANDSSIGRRLSLDISGPKSLATSWKLYAKEILTFFIIKHGLLQRDVLGEIHIMVVVNAI